MAQTLWQGAAVKQRVYLETTIVSYLTARPSRDLIVAARQQMTRQWWDGQREKLELYVSQLVLNEAAGGDSEAAAARLRMLDKLPLLPLTEEVGDLAKGLRKAGLLPQKAEIDCAHVAAATVHEMDVLLTWNCRHLANGLILGKVGRYLRARGYEAPTICTPDELMGE